MSCWCVISFSYRFLCVFLITACNFRVKIIFFSTKTIKCNFLIDLIICLNDKTFLRWVISSSIVNIVILSFTWINEYVRTLIANNMKYRKHLNKKHCVQSTILTRNWTTITTTTIFKMLKTTSRFVFMFDKFRIMLMFTIFITITMSIYAKIWSTICWRFFDKSICNNIETLYDCLQF